MQQLQPLVANSKLDRPLDSHPPLSRELMLTQFETDDWGDMYEDTQEDYRDQNIAQKVESLSKIILPSSAQLWLISLNSLKVTKVLIGPEEGACLEDVKQTFKDSLDNLFQVMEHDDDWHDHNASVEMFPLTRSRKRIMRNDTEQSEPTLTPAHSTTRAQSNLIKQLITPINEHGRLSWKRSPRNRYQG